MIRRLKERHFDAIKKHFGSLSSEDLRLRFGMSVNSQWVCDNYVGKLNAHRDILLGVFSGEDLVAFCHGAVCGHSVELGLSVLESHRGTGLGSLMIERVKAFAAAEGVGDVYVMCASDNTSMLMLARRHGMRMTSDHGESEGHVGVNEITGGDLAAAAADEMVADAADLGVDAFAIPMTVATRMHTQFSQIYLDAQARAAKIFSMA